MKKAYCSQSFQFHPDKNQHSQVTEVMKIRKKSKEDLESTLHYTDEIMEEKHVHMDEMREEERVRMAQNDNIISSDD